MSWIEKMTYSIHVELDYFSNCFSVLQLIYCCRKIKGADFFSLRPIIDNVDDVYHHSVDAEPLQIFQPILREYILRFFVKLRFITRKIRLMIDRHHRGKIIAFEKILYFFYLLRRVAGSRSCLFLCHSCIPLFFIQYNQGQMCFAKHD